jgi:2-C-methyl-D-erythritol 2,4-cyclodiphosphate synthase
VEPYLSTRVGIGIDVHPFAAGDERPCILGGVRLPGAGLAGHSDADVVAHAVADAVCGAAGLGDIGTHFPDDDPRWAGADSLALLSEIVRRAGAAGWALVNADCTIVAERPRIAPAREQMIERLSTAADAPVHVKATRPEGLGSLGRAEGVACIAVALVEGSSVGIEAVT